MEAPSEKTSTAPLLPNAGPPKTPSPGAVILGAPERLPEQDTACSFLWCRLPGLQRCANVKLFTALCTMILFLQSGLTSGYTYSVLTTIEKKFDMRSVSSGVMASAYEGGNLLTILFVSHFGSRQRVPAWLGLGSLLMSFGGATMLLPHLIKLMYYPTGYINHDFSESDWPLCRLNATGTPSLNSTCSAHELGDNHGLYVGLFFVAQFLLGIGMGPMVTLGAAYIDDHVRPKEASSFYLSFVYAGAALGPVFGYALGASMLTFDIEHFLARSPQSMAMDMPNWSGAWWGGYIFFSALLFLTSWMICLFPKSLPTGRHSDTLCKSDISVSPSLRNMAQASLDIVKSIPFLIITLAACFECAIVSGFLLFLPKYMETQFYVSHSVAGLVTGGVAVPAATAGIVLGGWINHKYKMTPVDTSRTIARTATLTILTFLPLFFIYCSPDPPVGLHLPKFLPEHGADFVEQSPCGSDCGCSPHQFQPVCDVESQTSFMSPCVAGCMERRNGVFVDCSCAESTVTEEGLCGMKCSTTLAVFLVMIFVIALLIGITHLPIVLLTMRAVLSENKSLALAMQMVIIRIVAYIPAPMAFGLIIDYTCLLWSDVTCEDDLKDATGACLFYDLDKFHRNYACLAFALQIASTIFFWLNYYVVNKDPALKSAKASEEEALGKKLRTRISAAVALQPMKGVLVGSCRTRPAHTSYVTA